MAKKKKNKKKDETERFNKEKAMTTRLIDDFNEWIAWLNEANSTINAINASTISDLSKQYILEQEIDIDED